MATVARRGSKITIYCIIWYTAIASSAQLSGDPV